MNQLSKISPQNLHEDSPVAAESETQLPYLLNQLGTPLTPVLRPLEQPPLTEEDKFDLMNFVLEEPQMEDKQFQAPPAPILRPKEIAIPEELYGFQLEESEQEEEGEERCLCQAHHQTFDEIPQIEKLSSDFQQRQKQEKIKRTRKCSFFDQSEGQYTWKREREVIQELEQETLVKGWPQTKNRRNKKVKLE